MRKILLVPMLLVCVVVVSAQSKKGGEYEQCGTMLRLEQLYRSTPGLKQKFESETNRVNETAKQKTQVNNRTMDINAAVIVPVVFHIVLPNPNIVTNTQILAQLDSLNKDFSNTNGSSNLLPSWFQNIRGKSLIQFCLAQRTPDGEETSGINRVPTNVPVFNLDDRIKTTALGGADSWDTERYLNVWISAQDDGILGYATFPTTTEPKFQGVVIDYRSLPGASYASYANYNRGKTLTHETGHFFGLFHIWGDDDGRCTGTDFVDDTPNQADASEGCKTGRFTDSCTASGDGILYQNYMDYSYDNCLMLFTAGQVTRMEVVFNSYRSSLATSNGCVPPQIYNIDAWLTDLIYPEQRVCEPTFSPVVTLRNRGNFTLTSATFNIVLNNQAPVTYAWAGNLPKSATTNVTLSPLTVPAGRHTLTIYTTNPNNQQDQNKGNDTVRIAFQYYPPVDAISESFEGATFPPPGWDIVNPDGLYTWEKTTTVAKSGLASVYINNFEYELFPSRDDLRTPEFALNNLDSAFLSFHVAAGAFSPLSTPNNNWDTLEVLISKDCGKTYTSLYKKWGADLVTRNTEVTSAYIPRSTEWRKDSVNLQDYINEGNLLVAFRNTTGYENNVYLDDINLRKVIINPNLKAKGFLVTPNPATTSITVQFYPLPTELKAVQLYSMTGQKIAEILVTGSPGVFYQFQTGGLVSGIYVVRAVFADRVVNYKIMKN